MRTRAPGVLDNRSRITCAETGWRSTPILVTTGWLMSRRPEERWRALEICAGVRRRPDWVGSARTSALSALRSLGTLLCTHAGSRWRIISQKSDLTSQNMDRAVRSRWDHA